MRPLDELLDGVRPRLRYGVLPQLHQHRHQPLQRGQFLRYRFQPSRQREGEVLGQRRLARPRVAQHDRPPPALLGQRGEHRTRLLLPLGEFGGPRFQLVHQFPARPQGQPQLLPHPGHVRLGPLRHEHLPYLDHRLLARHAGRAEHVEVEAAVPVPHAFQVEADVGALLSGVGPGSGDGLFPLLVGLAQQPVPLPLVRLPPSRGDRAVRPQARLAGPRRPDGHHREQRTEILWQLAPVRAGRRPVAGPLPAERPGARLPRAPDRRLQPLLRPLPPPRRLGLHPQVVQPPPQQLGLRPALRSVQLGSHLGPPSPALPVPYPAGVAPHPARPAA